MHILPSLYQFKHFSSYKFKKKKKTSKRNIQEFHNKVQIAKKNINALVMKKVPIKTPTRHHFIPTKIKEIQNADFYQVLVWM